MVFVLCFCFLFSALLFYKMSDSVIRVESVSKSYRLGQIGGGTLKEDFARWCAKLQGKPDPNLKIGQEHHARLTGEQFWALDKVSFEVKEGEVLGIIGRNGAGKSTLLKILSQVTTPTSGQIKIKGRIASLLEVGTGFHQELTGRENIFLNGAILGMTKAEIRKKFDEIVAFSGIEEFIDTPVKRYSSGMYVRLAFAVAAHLEPEILIVDEVLAVGDAEFQKKCLGKMQDVSKGGRTVLFVSHNMSAVMQLTSRGILLDNGRVRFCGVTEQVIQRYIGTSDSCSTLFLVDKMPRGFYGTQAARLISFRFDKPVPFFLPNEDFRFFANIRALKDVSQIRFSMTVFTVEGTPVGTCFGVERPGLRRGEEKEFEITLPNPRLAPGHYHCGVSVGKGDNRTDQVDYDTVLDTLSFEVRNEEGDAGTVANWGRGWGSIILPDLKY
jgi:lipopolysaccharide transport system ATP-binding protein